MPVLYLLGGAWASGKTATVAHLLRLLPKVAVYDWDLIIPGLSAASGKDVRTDPSTWHGLRETWRAIIGASLAADRDVLLCGPPVADEFAGGLGADVTVRRAYLDCPDDVLSDRLRSRGATEAEIEDEVSVAASLRESGGHRIPVDNGSPKAVAAEVAKWVEAQGELS